MTEGQAPCNHGEVECDVARATIRCRKCGAAATLDRERADRGATPSPDLRSPEGTDLRQVSVYFDDDPEGNGDAVLSVTLDAINADWLVEFLNGINAGHVYNNPVLAALGAAPQPEPEPS